ncbi:hypothetical protein I3842_05G221600 [Carya illinoinensis]|uniref:Uncharacterized protein n=1 Tax=Carya illinoinensis TaxID=32201 RepID=A0A922F5X6_CARIL|nr:hypothetical protein I3842_05G221600 [Carya illinoinensis]
MITFKEILDLLAEEGASWPSEPTPVNHTSGTGAPKHKYAPSGPTEFSANEVAVVELLTNLRSMTPENDSYWGKGTLKSRTSDSTVAIERNESLSLPENPDVSLDIAVNSLLAAVWKFRDEEEVSGDGHGYRPKL